MLSSLKKEKSEHEHPQGSGKKRAKWNKDSNKSMMDVNKKVIEQPKMQRRDSARTRQNIEESRQKMKKDIKKNKSKNLEFEVVFVGQEQYGDNSKPPVPKNTDDEVYIPTIQEKQMREVEKKVDKPKIESKPPTFVPVEQKPVRKRSGWNKNQQKEVMPVKDLSQERREWKRPAPIPKEERFEVNHINQEEEKVVFEVIF
jgi:hypothetical protein